MLGSEALIKSFYPVYPIAIAQRDPESPVRLGTRWVYADLPVEAYQCYFEAYDIAKNLLIEGRNAREVREALRRFLKEKCSPARTGDLYTIVLRKSRWGRRAYTIILKVRWIRFLRWIEEVASYYISRLRSVAEEATGAPKARSVKEVVREFYWGSPSQGPRVFQGVVGNLLSYSFMAGRLDILLFPGRFSVRPHLWERVWMLLELLGYRRQALQAVESLKGVIEVLRREVGKAILRKKVDGVRTLLLFKGLVVVWNSVEALKLAVVEEFNTKNVHAHLRTLIELLVYISTCLRDGEGCSQLQAALRGERDKSKSVPITKEAEKRRPARHLKVIRDVSSYVIHNVAPSTYFSLVEYVFTLKLLLWAVEVAGEYIREVLGAKVREVASLTWDPLERLYLDTKARRLAVKLASSKTLSGLLQDYLNMVFTSIASEVGSHLACDLLALLVGTSPTEKKACIPEQIRERARSPVWGCQGLLNLGMTLAYESLEEAARSLAELLRGESGVSCTEECLERLSWYLMALIAGESRLYEDHCRSGQLSPSQ